MPPITETNNNNNDKISVIEYHFIGQFDNSLLTYFEYVSSGMNIGID